MATPSQTITVTPLKEQLDATARHLALVLPAQAGQLIDAGTDTVIASGIADQSVKPGATAPDFTLIDTIGQAVTLTNVLATGPVVLTFFRGNWCPYCDVQLRAYQQALTRNPYRATLIAISPQTAEQMQRTANDKELQFPLLSDAGNRVARQYGLVYPVGGPVYDALKGIGIDLEAYNGDASGELPLTATYIIGTDGIISWVQNDPNFKRRADPDVVLNELAKLG